MVAVAPIHGQVVWLGWQKSGQVIRPRVFTSQPNGAIKPSPRSVSLTRTDGSDYVALGLADARLAQVEDKYMLTWREVLDSRSSPMMVAVSADLASWTVYDTNINASGPSIIVSQYSWQNRLVMYYEDGLIRMATSPEGQKWHSWDRFMLAPRSTKFDHGLLSILASWQTSQGVLTIYDASIRKSDSWQLRIGALFTSTDEPFQIIWRSERPLIKVDLPEQQAIRPVGSVLLNGYVHCYWQKQDGSVFTMSALAPTIKKLNIKRHVSPLVRHRANPILEPTNQAWESTGTFNPAVLHDDDGIIHLIYRAVGHDGLSVFGYAKSEDGTTITERSTRPAYWPREIWEGVNSQPSRYSEIFLSGGGWGGCEDPKLTRIGDTVYMTYVAFNGWGPPRAALTSLHIDDFRAQNWNWSPPQLISPPDTITKSACLLSEKINGKFVMFHRIFPDILIDYLDDLEFGEDKWLAGHDRIGIRASFWDSRKLSIGAPPIKCDQGWLAIYHAVDDRDPSRYKMGAMLLDRDNPSRVIRRTSRPLICPDVHYENEGKPGVVYPSGAAIKDDRLLVYYGGGDRVVCVAESPIKKFMSFLMKSENIDAPLKIRPEDKCIRALE